MSEILTNPEPEQSIEMGGMTDEEIAELEAQRAAELEAKIEPFRSLKTQLETQATELTDLQMALVDVYEQMLIP